MLSHGYATDAPAKSAALASTILSATSPPEISAACDAVSSFLRHVTPDQSRHFFSLTFPTLICKLFGFDTSSPQSSWIDSASSSGTLFDLLNPNSILISSIFAVDSLGLVKYVFPIERLPEYIRVLLQKEREIRVLEDLCPLFRGKIKGDSSKGLAQVQLNVFEYYMFWFAYYPVCRGNCEAADAVRVQRSMKNRLENWTQSLPRFPNAKRVTEKRVEYSLYVRLLYAYLRAFVPVSDLGAQPYRSSLLHYSSGHDNSVRERAEFVVNTLIQFWLVDNDFSPFAVNVCKSLGVSLPIRSLLGETPPTSGLGEVVELFVKYLSLSSVAPSEMCDQMEYSGTPLLKVLGSESGMKLRNDLSLTTAVCSAGSWNSWIQRPLYRFILRTFLFCPMETSIKNASQVFSVWISYIEPWAISLSDFKELEEEVAKSGNNKAGMISEAKASGYTSPWQGFVLSNYAFFSSLVMHFIGFAHKFLHADPDAIVKMVLKVLNVLTSSTELIDLIKNVDTVFHAVPLRSSKSMLNNLSRFVPTIREQLQDWGDGLCESDADGSFLHENWNRDLRLFCQSEDGGHQLLQLFVMRAESELQAISSDNGNLQCLDSIKRQIGCLFGGSVIKPLPISFEEKQHQDPHQEIFKPRRSGTALSPNIRYKGDWMKRPISNDEVAWLAKLLISLSGWLNQLLGLNQGENGSVGPSWSYLEVSRDVSDVRGVSETAKVMLCSIVTSMVTLCRAAIRCMKNYGWRVNLRMLASKKVLTVLLVVFGLNLLRKSITQA